MSVTIIHNGSLARAALILPANFFENNGKLKAKFWKNG